MQKVEREELVKEDTASVVRSGLWVMGDSYGIHSHPITHHPRTAVTSSGNRVAARLVPIGGTTNLLIIREWMRRLLVLRRNRQPGELLEIRQRRVPPPAGLALLDLQKLRDLGEPVGVDRRVGRTPTSRASSAVVDAGAVAIDQLVPERATGVRAVVQPTWWKNRSSSSGVGGAVREPVADRGAYCATALLPLAVRSKPMPGVRPGDSRTGSSPARAERTHGAGP